MKLRLQAWLDRLPRNRLQGWLRGTARAGRAATGADGAESETGGSDEDGADDPAAVRLRRPPGELIGLGLAMCVALSFVTLLVLLAAPAASGCGSRQVAGPTAAAPAAPPEAASAPAPAVAAAPAAAPPDATTTAAPAVAPPAPPPSSLVGDYECRFTRGNRELAPVPCAIRAGDGGALRIEQAGGAVRLSGNVTEDEAGFRLDGEVTCTSGPCPGPGGRNLLFFNQGPGAYSAVLLLRGGRFLNIDIVRRD
jgi:hypothetical protein